MPIWSLSALGKNGRQESAGIDPILSSVGPQGRCSDFEIVQKLQNSFLELISSLSVIPMLSEG